MDKKFDESIRQASFFPFGFSFTKIHDLQNSNGRGELPV